MNNKELINKLKNEQILTKSEFIQLIGTYTKEDREYAAKEAREAADKVFGKKIFI